ncbi:hypothetical protein [Comamonas composti]|uniref:hypothetical protein n=1 Tax=Comamonas composti TaxID=408558 RepID=UPI00047CEF0B|nr:hypothetical protein [Comamonas composti]
MQPIPKPLGEPAVAMPVMVAADMQDALLVAMRDLHRLEGLLSHATENLLVRFDETHDQLAGQPLQTWSALDAARASLKLAVTELQFHDMSSQLIAHITQTLQACAFRLATVTMGVDEGEDESQAEELAPIPERPNPVTQSEMDAGSIELF